MATELIIEPSKVLHSREINMKRANPITCLFLDIGGVLLSNGWDHYARKRATKHFNLKWADMEERHNLTFDTYEEGAITLKEYLNRVIFYKKRVFTRAQFKSFMFLQSSPNLNMIHLARKLKEKYRLKIFVVSNEARDLNAHRIQKFKLNEFVDSFISSCFIHIRKPDEKIFHLALDIAQVHPGEVLYIENTPLFVQVAEDLGIRSILHTDYKSTCKKLSSLGFHLDDRFSP